MRIVKEFLKKGNDHSKALKLGGWLVLVALLFLLVLIVVFCWPKGEKPSSQEDYPTLPVPALLEVAPMSLEQQVKSADLIVDATVQEVLPEESRQYRPEEASPEQAIAEKNGSGANEYQVRPIKLHVNERVKGSCEQEITLYIPPIALDCAPELQPGDRLFFLLHPYVGGGYTSVSVQAGYYYIAHDNKVYPALPTEELKELSGIQKDELKRKMQAVSDS